MPNKSFDDVAKKMPEYLKELDDCELVTPDIHGNLPLSAPPSETEGIYCFYENGKPLYVGRTRNLRKRVLEHREPSGKRDTASFAFNLAKEEFKKEHPGRNVDDMLKEKLERDSDFAPLFCKAKARVRKMSVRFVKIEGPIEQTIFEIYAHMELGAPPRFNNIGNY